MFDPYEEQRRQAAIITFVVFVAFFIGYMLGSASGGPPR
jgi:hypothetical protein